MSAKRVNNTHFCQKTNQKKNTYKKVKTHSSQKQTNKQKTKQHMYRVKYKL